MTSSYHGNMISGSQKSFLTETVVFSLSNDGRKVWDTVLLLIEIMHKNHTCQFFLFSPAMFAGPRLVEIQKVCYLDNLA